MSTANDAAPQPLPDQRSAPFFEGAAAGKLMLQRCASCRRWQHPVRSRCPECAGTEIEWARASGRGTVFSHGRLWRASHPSQEDALPVTLVVVDLDEGVRMSAKLVGASDSVSAGQRVRVEFEAHGEGAPFPVFRLDTTA